METITISRKELYDLVWSTPLTSLSKKYLISDNALRKMCIDMNIPMPKSGHWGKIQFNKPVEIIALPSEYTGEQNIKLIIREEGDNSKGQPTHETILEKEIITKHNADIIVSDRLVNPDKLVIEARDLLTDKRSYSRDGIVNTHGQVLNIKVTKENIIRALRFMDAFVKVMKKRGHAISFENHTSYLMIQGEKIEFYLREKLSRVKRPSSNTSWQEYDYLPTGKLVLNVKIRWQITGWQDGKLSLEQQLATIIAKLEIRGQELKQASIERELYWAEQRELERIEKEKQKRKDLELDKFRGLLKSSKQWQEAQFLRQYIDCKEAEAIKTNNYTDDFKNWLIWAREKTDWYDPIVEKRDSILSDSDREKLVPKEKP